MEYKIDQNIEALKEMNLSNEARVAIQAEIDNYHQQIITLNKQNSLEQIAGIMNKPDKVKTNAIKYEFEGEKQKIIPINISQLILLLQTVKLLKN